MLFDPSAFTKETLEFLEDYAPGLAIRIMNLAKDRDYQLLASFTAYCLIAEAQNRGSELPPIEAEDITHPNPKIAELLKKDFVTKQEATELDNLFKFHRIKTLKEIEDTNPHLYWGITTLLNPLRDRRLLSGVYGVVHQYDAIKSNLG